MMYGIDNVAHLGLKEDELSRILYYLPEDDPIRPYLQQAGINIFRWK